MRARGLRPRGVRGRLALTTFTVLPSVQDHGVGTPIFIGFRGSIPGPHVPLSTLHPYPCGYRRMTRGRCGSLLPSPYGSFIRYSFPATGAFGLRRRLYRERSPLRGRNGLGASPNPPGV